MENKVWILNRKSYHDYSKAERYGELNEIFGEDLPIFQTDKLIQMIREKIEIFSIEDSLLLSGNPLINIIAVSYLLSKHKQLKVLLFNVFNGDFILRTLRKEDLEYGKRKKD